MKKQLILLSCGTIVMFLIFLFNRPAPVKEPMIIPIIEESNPTLLNEEVQNLESLDTELEWVVDVKGEVNSPGVYVVDPSLRVYDVIEQAGGLTAEANQKALNLAQKIEDEMIIYVPHVEEEESSLLVAWPTHSKEGTLSLNQASVEQLQGLPGIGAVKAQAIIEYRTSQGPFKSVDDLLQVNGIGSKTLEGIRDLIGI